MSKLLVKQSGFTIVELLIVIVIIAILATLTIVAYNGIQGRAQIASDQSGLEQASKKLALYAVDNSAYPANLPAVGVNNSSGTSFQYSYDNSVNPQTYCVTATTGTTAYMISSTNTIPQSGVCPGQIAPGSGQVANGGVVTTLAGSGAASYADGTGTAASFNFPASVAVDSNGNVYVADVNNQRIRKVTSTGVVTTLAGSGAASYADGTGTAASFNAPQGVAVDSSGNVYVADTNNGRIRKITPVGVVTTLAGSGIGGSTDGTGTAASFSQPVGITVDSSGNVYVGDYSNQRIRKITPVGVVTTLAGSGTAGSTDGTGTAASFYYPQGVAVDSSGNVYVADMYSIRKVTPAGVVTTLAGSGVAGSANGTGVAASFNRPIGVAVDSSSNVYVADFNNNSIRKITPAGVVTTLAGSVAAGYADGTGAAALFSRPIGVTVDSTGTVYVADMYNNRIRVIR